MADPSTPSILLILRFALEATHKTAQNTWITTEPDDNPRHQTSHFQKLVEAIIFSRRFILSYQLVLLVLLFGFTVRHWGRRIQAWRRRRRHWKERRTVIDGKNALSSSTSSSSSTLQGSGVATPPGDDLKPLHETTPLLPSRSLPPSPCPCPSWGSTLKSCLTYQPSPVPLINKSLPSNATTLSILLFYALQIFYTFYKTPLSIPFLFVFADRTSLLFVANIPLLYLLAAKNQPIKVLTGYSYEALNIFHRRLGEVLCLLALLHSAGMVGVWYTLLRPSGLGLVQFLFKKIILLGLGAFISYELIYFTSLGSFRKRWYELFLVLHIVLQLAAGLFVWFHHHNSRPYVGAALGIWVVDRVVYRILLKRRCFRAELEGTEDGETVILRARLPCKTTSFPARIHGGRDVQHGWLPTQHIFLSVPALAPKHIIQAHPFTIASAAPTPLSTTIQDMMLIIRAQDGFSQDLVEYSRTHTAAKIQVDGPYGSQSAVELLQDSDLAIIVAGGSGIAVAWPLVCSVLSGLSSSTDTAVPATRDQNDIEDLAIQKSPVEKKKILFIWVIRHPTHMSWLDPTSMYSLRQHADVDFIIPPPTYNHGHPDIGTMMEDWVTLNAVPTKQQRKRIGLICSGPDAMNRSIRNTAAGMIRRGWDLDIEVEKFGW